MPTIEFHVTETKTRTFTEEWEPRAMTYCPKCGTPGAVWWHYDKGDGYDCDCICLECDVVFSLTFESTHQTARDAERSRAFLAAIREVAGYTPTHPAVTPTNK